MGIAPATGSPSPLAGEVDREAVGRGLLLSAPTSTLPRKRGRERNAVPT